MEIPKSIADLLALYDFLGPERINRIAQEKLKTLTNVKPSNQKKWAGLPDSDE